MKNLYPSLSQDIVEGFISGNQTDFEFIYHAVSTPLFKIILLKVKDTQIAEQLLEAAFVKAWQCRAAFDPANESIIQWLYKICRHQILRLQNVKPVLYALATYF